MIEILGTELTENALAGDTIGAFVGALIVAYALYVVARVKHESEIIENVDFLAPFPHVLSKGVDRGALRKVKQLDAHESARELGAQ